MKSLETQLSSLRVPGLGRWLLVVIGLGGLYFFMSRPVLGLLDSPKLAVWQVAVLEGIIGLGALSTLMGHRRLALTAVGILVLSYPLFIVWQGFPVQKWRVVAIAAGLGCGFQFGLIALLFGGDSGERIIDLLLPLLLPPTGTECSPSAFEKALTRIPSAKWPPVARRWMALAAALLLRPLLGRLAFFRFLRSVRVPFPQTAALALMPSARPEDHTTAQTQARCYLKAAAILGMTDAATRLFGLAVRLAAKHARVRDADLAHLDRLGKNLLLEGTWQQGQMETLQWARRLDRRTAAKILGVPEGADRRQVEAAWREKTALGPGQGLDTQAVTAARIRLLADRYITEP